MKQMRAHYLAISSALTSLCLLSGCAKHMTTMVPTPPPPQAPTVSLTATPGSIQQGQSAELSWHAENATDASITGLGAVSFTGSRSITPPTSTTYTLVAKGPGGTRETSARVTVNVASATSRSELSDQELLSRNVKDVFFDYDQYSIRNDQSQQVDSDAQFLMQHPELKVVIEGHCDERGSEDYNLALGDSRANTVKQALVSRGVKPDQISVISYGKEKPFCTKEDEQCWQQNRRDHFVSR
jgi:peptidoglycan-associated lipoprotein